MSVDVSGFAFYLDANLTAPLQTDLFCVQKDDGSSDPCVFELWFGSPLAAYKVQADSDPGTDPIVVNVTDSAAGSGHEAEEVKLSLTESGLSSATGGASLTLGTTINGGISNAVKFYVQIDDATGTVGFANELGIETNDLITGVA